MTALPPSIGLVATVDHVPDATSSERLTVSGPESKTRPSGATNMNGYSGMKRCADGICRHVFVAGSNTSGSVFEVSTNGWGTPERPRIMLSPDRTSTRPSASVVAVGYQRDCAMSASRVHVRVRGSKTVVSFSPTFESTWPPTTRSRPSASTTWPEQNRFRLYGTGMNVPPAGSHSRSESGAKPNASKTRTSPSSSSVAWTATSGHDWTALHWPVVSAPETAACDGPSTSAAESTHSTAARATGLARDRKGAPVGSSVVRMAAGWCVPSLISRRGTPGNGPQVEVLLDLGRGCRLYDRPPMAAWRRAVGRGFLRARLLVNDAHAKGFSLLAAGAFASFGRESVLEPPIRLSGEERIAIGGGVYVGAGSWLQVVAGHGSGVALEIGDGTSISGNVVLSAASSLRLGRSVLIARGTYVADHSHAYTDTATPVLDQGITDVRPVSIGDGAWLGENVVVGPGVTIGRGAVVGANAVVLDDVPDFAVAVGAPARVVRRFAESDARGPPQAGGKAGRRRARPSPPRPDPEDSV